MASQWRIRHKLMLGLFLVVGTIALLLGGTLRGLWSYHSTIKEMGDSLSELLAADLFKESVAELNWALTEKGEKATLSLEMIQSRLMDRIKASDINLKHYEDQLKANAERNGESGHLEDQRARIKDIRKGLEDLKQAADVKRFLKEKESKSTHASDAEVMEEFRKPIRALIAHLDLTAADLRNVIHEDLNGQSNQSRPIYQGAIWIIIPASIIGLLSISVLMRVNRWIFNPIRDLEAGVNRVARGDFDHKIEVHSGDEMEDLAAAFNDMTGRLRELYGDLARQVNERSRQLVRSERLASVGFLAAGVAHEINNPLASIAFCSEALEGRLADLLDQARSGGRRPDDEEVFARYLKMIQEEAFRCKKITEKLLEFSRTGERRREPTDLAGLVRSVIDITQHLQSCKGKEIEFEPLPERLVGRIAAPVNAEEIKSVVLNLVVNALDSMGEGGKLSIRLALRDGMAEMHFSDTGCGMTHEVLENIFEPFFTRSRTGKGTGLGLTISHRIINQHGGEIEAASEGLNQGSTFVVRLPLTEREPKQAHSGPAQPARRAA